MKTHAFAAIAAALFISAPAHAQPPMRSVVIPTAGLDLATAGGRARLDARIRDAAHATCDASAADLRGQVQSARCRADVMAAAQTHRDRLVAMRSRAGLLAARR